MADTKLIRLDGTTLVFEMKDGENKTHNLMTKYRADIALDAIFVAIGSNAPMDKSLDLTFSKQSEDESAVEPKQTIAKGKIPDTKGIKENKVEPELKNDTNEKE